MADKPAEASVIPPVASHATFFTFINYLRDTGIPDQIDKHVLSRLGGSSQGQVLNALRFFGWISGDKNSPTDAFRRFILAAEPERKEIYKELLRRKYPLVFADGVVLANQTVGSLEKLIAPEAKGETLRKCFAFFTAGANFVGLELGEHAKKKRGGPRIGKRSSKKQNNNNGTDGGAEGTEDDTPPGMVKTHIALSTSKTWYIVTDDPPAPEDVKRFVRMIGLVLDVDLQLNKTKQG